MRFNPKLKQEMANYFDYVIIVEGKKDVESMQAMGFTDVYPLHMTGVPLRQRVEEIAGHLSKKDKVCILTDFDKKGKMLYLKVKPMFQELGVRLDSTLRGIIIKSGVSHIEGLDTFMGKVDKIG